MLPAKIASDETGAEGHGDSMFKLVPKSEAIDAAALRDGALEGVYNPVFKF